MNRFLSPLFRRLLSACLLAVSALGSSLLAAEDKAPTGPVVELPKFEVTDSKLLPEPEAWRYGEIPGFEVLSNASDKATKRLIKDFAMFRDALTAVWPMPERPGLPTSLILCGKGNKFETFLPKKDQGDTAKVTASIFLKGKEQNAILIDLQATTLNLLTYDTTDDASTGTDSSILSVDHDKVLYREYVHYLLSRSEPRLPAWFEEGMAQIIMAMKVEPKYILFGKVEDPNLPSAAQGLVMMANAALGGDDGGGGVPGAPAEDVDFNAALKRRALIPLKDFFAVTHDSPEALNPLGNNVWAKQAYAFVHMCLYQTGKKYQKPFAQLLQRAVKEPITEEVFKDCFKMSFKEMAMQLRGYIDFTNYEAKEYYLKKGSAELGSGPAMVLRDATEAEVGRIKGEAYLLAGYKEKAGTELSVPYRRGERDPRLLAALGLYDRANGDEVRGRKILEAAAAQKVVRPRVYLDLARIRFDAAVAKPGAGQALSAEQVAGINSLLLTARAQPPAMPEVYELMADTWARAGVPPKKEDVIYLVEGVQRFPTRLRLLYLTTQLSVQADMLDVAYPLVDHGIRIADPKGKTMFEQLKATMPPPPPAAAAGTPAPKR